MKRQEHLQEQGGILLAGRCPLCGAEIGCACSRSCWRHRLEVLRLAEEFWDEA